MGTLLELEGSSITLVATDGYRLAKWTSTLERPVRRRAPSTSSLRARSARRRATSARPRCSKRPTLGAQANQLMLTAGTTSIVVRLVDGQYPNYGQVIPAKFDRSVTVNTSASDRRLAPRRAGRRRPRVDGQARGRQQHADDHGQIRRHRQRLRRARGRADRRRSDDRVQRALLGRDPQPRRLAADRARVSGPALAGRDPAAREPTISARSSSC